MIEKNGIQQTPLQTPLFGVDILTEAIVFAMKSHITVMFFL